MPTDEMLIKRFQRIKALMSLEEGAVDSACGLREGSNGGQFFRMGEILSICDLSIEELEENISLRVQKEKSKHYKGVADGEIPAMI